MATVKTEAMEGMKLLIVEPLSKAQEPDGACVVAADAVLLGSGVHMGGIESTMAAFFERSAPLWIQGARGIYGRTGPKRCPKPE